MMAYMPNSAAANAVQPTSSELGARCRTLRIIWLSSKRQVTVKMLATKISTAASHAVATNSL
jgi:hypothetical protein